MYKLITKYHSKCSLKNRTGHFFSIAFFVVTSELKGAPIKKLVHRLLNMSTVGTIGVGGMLNWIYMLMIACSGMALVLA